MRALAVLLLAATASPALPALMPFGHACVPQGGVRFCPTTSLVERVPMRDGVPIDVDVTLPPTGDGPFPTIMMLHGLGGDKTAFEAPTAAGTDNITFHFNNVFLAQRGYAVVNPTARGWGNSCGAPASRTPDCVHGWIHLADQRWEVRDAQDLLGMLVDEGIADPEALASTGHSYGGGQSLQLAALRDQIRGGDGRLHPWRSPAGRRLRLAAAWARWPWIDLAAALLPNGRFRDDRPSTLLSTDFPIGVSKLTYTEVLLDLARATAFLTMPNQDPTCDLETWSAELDKGEPYGILVHAVEDELHAFHGSVGLLRRRRPAPVLLMSGFTDDLFPASQSFRVRLALLRKHRPPVFQLGDLGHPRASNKLDEYAFLNEQGAEFFDAYLRKIGEPPTPGTVTVFTQTCPVTAPAGGPIFAARLQDLARGAFSLGDPAPQTVTSDGGDPALASAVDPIFGNGICGRHPTRNAPGTAVYTAPSPGFTLIGQPTLKARVRTKGPFGQIVGRLWDVGTDGLQTLIASGVYRLRPRQRNRIVFQLEGNAYQFAAGHTVRVELVGSSPPTFRPSNGTFSVRVDQASIELPTMEGSPSGAFLD